MSFRTLATRSVRANLLQSSFTQTRAAHAIANPTLAGIEKRWEAMPPQEQAELWMQLRDRMKVDWNEMTLQEKKAGMFFFFFLGGLRRRREKRGEAREEW